MATQNQGRDTQGGSAGQDANRPGPDELVGALEANANAEGFATGERTTELEDGMGDLGAQETTAAGPHLTPDDTVHHGAAATELNPTHPGTAGIPEKVERLEKEKFQDQDKGEPAP